MELKILVVFGRDLLKGKMKRALGGVRMRLSAVDHMESKLKFPLFRVYVP